MKFVKNILRGRKKGGKVDPLGLAVELGEPVADADLPKCAIVILNWNGKQHLKPCFETLAALDYPKDKYEVVLVDNGSSDDTSAVISRFPGIRHQRLPYNLGFAKAVNVLSLIHI